MSETKNNFSWEGNIPQDLDENEYIYCSCGILFNVNKFPPRKKGLLGNQGLCFRCPQCEKTVMDVEKAESENE